MEFTNDHYDTLAEIKPGHEWEYLDFFAGEKQALYGSLRSEEKREAMAELCNEFDYAFMWVEDVVERYEGERFFAARTDDLMGDLIMTVPEYQINLHPDDRPDGDPMVERGRLLGYPDCCSAYYDNTDIGPDECIPHKIPAFETYPFYTNRFLRLYKGRSLLSHFPCTYDCEESIAIGEQRLSLIEEYDPEFAEELRHHLTSFVIYVHGEGVLYSPEYTRDGNTVRHDGLQSGRYDTADDLIDWGTQADVAHVNGPNSVTIDGETKAGDHVAVLTFD